MELLNLPTRRRTEDDRLFAVNSLIIGRVVPRGSLGATRVQLRRLHAEINVLVVHVLDGVGLDPETDDAHPFVFLRTSLDSSVYTHNNLNVVEQKVLRLSRFILLSKPNREASDMIGPWDPLYWSVKYWQVGCLQANGPYNHHRWLSRIF